MRMSSNHRKALAFLSVALLYTWSGAAEAQTPRTVQPGLPGEASRTVGELEIARTAGPPHTEADTRFIQGMIHHHLQALVMTDLVAERTTNPEIRLLARRIELSQDDELLIMRTWLEDRGEPVPRIPGADHDAMDHGAMDHDAVDHEAMDHAAMGHGAPGHAVGDDGELMPGMLTDGQLSQLAAASGSEFDRLFLEFMIHHHEGALIMVQELFSTGAAGQEEEIFTFASHVEADQSIEIRRMRSMLSSLP